MKNSRWDGQKVTAAQVPQGWPLSGGLTVVYFAPLISCALHPSPPPPPPFRTGCSSQHRSK